MLEVVFAILLWYATILHSSVWVTGFFALCYLLWYTDGKEYTGERRWNAFRRFSLWRRIAPIDRFIENRAQLCNGGRAVKRIYVLYPCDTLFAALWGVGLHGGELEFADHLHFIVPPLLMAVPLLRDLLMWSGAVTWRPQANLPKERCIEALIAELLSAGRNVCIMPSWYENVTLPDFARETEDTLAHALHQDEEVTAPSHLIRPLSDELLLYAFSERVEVVIMTVRNERLRYWFPLSWRALTAVQRWMLAQARIAYPLPFLYCLRFWSRIRPPRLKQLLSPVLVCERSRYATNEIWHATVAEMIDAHTCLEDDDSPLLYEK